MQSFRRSDLYARLIFIETILILFFFALCIIPATSAFAATVNLAWNASSGSNVAGYKMYYGTSSRNYSYNVNAGKNTSCSLSGLQEGKKYYFAATAYNSSNAESSYSSEISYTVPTGSTSSTSSTGSASGTSSTGSTSTSTSSGTSGSSSTLIIDNGGSGTRSSGSWPVSGGPNSYGTKSVYSKSVGATYTFQAVRSGKQDVYVWYTPYASRNNNVPVKITTSSGVITKMVNQQQNAGKWYLLGTYNFSGQAKVVIESNSSSKSTCADAVRFAPAGSSSTSSSSTSSGSTGASGSTGCTLNTKFKTIKFQNGAPYYTDRDYTITGGIPASMNGLNLIRTVNNQRSNTSSSGYVLFTNPIDSWVYVLFDSRSRSIPNWLKSWELRSDKIKTSLSSQPYLKVYRKQFDAGQCVDLGGNYGSGSSIETRSNYVVVYGK